MAYPILQFTLMPLCRLIFIKKIKGLENIPKKGPYILASNHNCQVDGVILSCIFLPRIKGKIHFFAKEEIESYYGKFVEKLLFRRYAETITIEKVGTPGRGHKALKKATALLKKGEVIGVFPEGRRSLTYKLLKGRTGVARLALWAKVPVIPVGIKGKFDLEKPLKFHIFYSGRAEVTIGKPMYFKYKKINHRVLRTVTTKIMKTISKFIKRPYPYS
ncbi:1-acyl-sn-glycerol-3-phosphate acyltransferase [Candidatus Woesearchaeota archaeon]|nr:1-acyl-sn-glycerol-3-phosphate acyltransferase [Candidatus Woesearchaeota archaeon]